MNVFHNINVTLRQIQISGRVKRRMCCLQEFSKRNFKGAGKIAKILRSTSNFCANLKLVNFTDRPYSKKLRRIELGVTTTSKITKILCGKLFIYQNSIIKMQQKLRCFTILSSMAFQEMRSCLLLIILQRLIKHIYFCAHCA